jgi:hypothetical protein
VICGPEGDEFPALVVEPQPLQARTSAANENAQAIRCRTCTLERSKTSSKVVPAKQYTPGRNRDRGARKKSPGSEVAMEVVELVCTFKTTLVELDPFRLTEDGFTEQIASGGAPEHDRETDPLNPPTGVTCTENEPVWPGEIVVELPTVPLATEKSDPAPDKLTVCGLLLASSVIVNEALREPVPAGANIIETVQVADGVRLVPQEFESTKSAAFGPVMDTLFRFKLLFPELLMEMLCAVLVVPTSCEP